jgi:signal transduction histidine kinase
MHKIVPPQRLGIVSSRVYHFIKSAIKFSGYQKASKSKKSMKMRHARFEKLIDVNRQLSQARDTSEYLDLVIVAAAELTVSEAATIFELDEEAGNLRFLAMAGTDHKALEALEHLSVPVEGSVAGEAVRRGEPVIVRDVRDIPYHFKHADQVSGYTTRSILAVPILFQGTMLGVIEALNKPAGTDYNEDDVTILETLSVQAAVAIQNFHLQRALDQTRQEAERLTRMKNDFIAITSHELRTPLGLILGHATFLRELINAEYQEYVDTIVRNAMKLKEIIENMTNADNFQSGTAVVRRRSVSVKRIIKDVIDLNREAAQEKKINIVPDLPKNDDLDLEGDAEKIGIAISHLVKNAITFTNSGGHIFINAEKVPGYIKISIIDNGIGIPAKDLPHVFERFFQVESHLTRKHGGMGLGLSVAKMMVEMHGGRIWAESVEGKGSQFIILLPLDSAQAEAAGKVFIS